MSHRFDIWDVFTDRPYAGNQLAIVFDADDLDPAAMQAITREFNFAETSFVLRPEDSAHTARVRIFTPGYEMPFAGHPTVGTALAIAADRTLAGPLMLELKAGLFPVDIDEGRNAATFANPNAPVEAGRAPSPEAIERALSLPAGSLNRATHRPRRIDAGVAYVFACARADVVAAAAVDHPAFEALALEQTVGLLLYTDETTTAGVRYRVRMFAPGAGVVEDAATGSAAAALPGQLALAGALPDGPARFAIEQGVEMGRPSRIDVAADISGAAACNVRIGGSARKVATGMLY